ncbi:unnamed protein product, partial [Fusarium graminearum]
MDKPKLHQRDVTRSRFGDNARINMGDIHYHLPHIAARAEVVRVIPYPRNEDLVQRPNLINRLDKLLPLTPGSRSAALWGLGGSGNEPSKTQIALDYAYRRCDADNECCVFWVHADSEATFLADYKTIGTVLWTSRDAHIAGTLVGARHGIEVRSMAMNEASMLLGRIRDEPLIEEEEVPGDAGDALLQELQCLPLAISQAGAYMRRMSMTAEQYLSLLREGKTRWEVLKLSDTDRYRRPQVSNSVLETWRISLERIRTESEISYRILHVIAYVGSQDIPQELMVVAGQYDADSIGSAGHQDSTGRVSELELLEAITRLREFSFLSLTDDGGQKYEMHKLVQEAIRYGLRVRGSVVLAVGNALRVNKGPKEDEEYYCGKALQVVDDLFPTPEPATWARCEEYLTHAIRLGEWAEVGRTEIKTATLLATVSYFLHERGRWKEKEPVDKRALELRREVLGEKHPDTIWSMAELAATYHRQGQYNKAEEISVKVLELRRGVLGEKHLDTIWSM